MNIGIIGAGNIGANVARLVTKAGHEVRIANSRGPASLQTLIDELGPAAKASSAEDAVAFGDIVLVAIPWTAKEESLGESGPYDGKIVIDAMNPYTEDFEIEDLGDRTSSEITKTLVPGARLVKAFNTIFYRRLASEGKPRGVKGRLAIPVAGDDADAKRIVMELIDAIGFDAVDSGGLVEGGRRQQPGTPVYNQPFDAAAAREALARA
jgi:predicted dinucleotide-binding enzyme